MPVLARAGSACRVPRAEGEPESPPSIRIFDAGGAEVVSARSVSRDQGAGRGWVLTPTGILPRGRYRIDLSWDARVVRHVLIVL